MNKNEFNKGDRVYVSFDIVDYVIKDGNSHGELNGKFEGYGVLDRVEDGRVYGRRDDGLPFTCFEDDVQKVQPNPNKSGVRVITPSGEAYVCAWDLASKDGEG